MPQAKSVLKEIKESVTSLFKAKDDQYNNFVRGIEGQFELFKDKLQEQQELMKQIGEHVQREQLHREKVYDKFVNNGKKVREALASYEDEVTLDLEGVDVRELRALMESNVSPDLAMVQKQLSENQLNLEAFNQIVG